MKKTLLMTMTVLALASCGGNKAPAEAVEITDMNGRVVNVTPGSYKKVVCIGAGALRMYSYVGDVSLLAGVEDIENETLSSRPKMFDGVARPYFIANKDVFKTLPSCGVGGPQAQAAEAEKILSCNPDIVISEYEDVEKANALQEQIGIPVITLKYGSKGIFDEKVEGSLEMLGKIFGREKKATALNEFIASEKNAISEATKAGSSDRVYICGLGNWGTTNHLQTAQNYEPFNVAHITNVVDDLSKDGIQGIDAEKFAALAPSMDKMIFDAAAVKNIKPLYAENPHMFDDCKAWKNGEVYLQMAYNAYYTNLEIALANTWFNAKAVYGLDVDMNSKLDEITEKFNGKKLAAEINAYPNSFGGYQKVDTATFFGTK